VNHLNLVGWISITQYKLAEWTGNKIKLKLATFYLRVTHSIAELVKGLLWKYKDERQKKGKASGGSMSSLSEGKGGTIGLAPGVE
jgi:hypothetical protein